MLRGLYVAHSEHHTEIVHQVERSCAAARPVDTDRTAHTDDATTGRHALRDDESGATGTADPRGIRNPKTEEHTR